mmetsp:Transcript_19896/g.57158  ORF Transcript_19896/g.57158 Transcript_19896/m.57158 type:complete len:210 (-) Transcript_19896:141-770(-)
MSISLCPWPLAKLLSRSPVPTRREMTAKIPPSLRIQATALNDSVTVTPLPTLAVPAWTLLNLFGTGTEILVICLLFSMVGLRSVPTMIPLPFARTNPPTFAPVRSTLRPSTLKPTLPTAALARLPMNTSSSRRHHVMFPLRLNAKTRPVPTATRLKLLRFASRTSHTATALTTPVLRVWTLLNSLALSHLPAVKEACSAFCGSKLAIPP